MFMYILLDSLLPKTSFKDSMALAPREERSNDLPNYGDMKRKNIVIVLHPKSIE